MGSFRTRSWATRIPRQDDKTEIEASGGGGDKQKKKAKIEGKFHWSLRQGGILSRAHESCFLASDGMTI